MIDPALLSAAPIWYVVFVFSLTCHEAAHAWLAKRGGDDTAYLGGQVTLNPVPHIQRSPFGTVVVPLISYLYMGWMIGWASAPYDPHWQQRYPHRAAYMALGGPVANFILVILAGVGIKVGMMLGVFAAPSRLTGITDLVAAPAGGAAATVALFLSIMFCLNLLLALFNMIPVPPLDGHTVVGLFMSEKNALRFYNATQNSPFALLGIFIAWKVIGYVFWPSMKFALMLLYPGTNYQ
ncbi:MAG: site-2 protease family protein [Deferribacteres bacterium]|nr:site-2 protease family protein [candidate division KSB1 bacterium]MCB9509989.1 site-2 protease family protein [Deferribacteres bacterium]